MLRSFASAILAGQGSVKYGRPENESNLECDILVIKGLQLHLSLTEEAFLILTSYSLPERL